MTTPFLRTPVYDGEVVCAFFKAHSRIEVNPQRGREVYINGIHVPADGSNSPRYLVTGARARKEPFREPTLERRLHQFGFTLMDLEDWVRDNYDGWNGRWVPVWEKEAA